MATKEKVKVERVQVSAFRLVTSLINGTPNDGQYSTRGVQVVHVLRNGNVKITYNDGEVLIIPYDPNKQ